MRVSHSIQLIVGKTLKLVAGEERLKEDGINTTICGLSELGHGIVRRDGEKLMRFMSISVRPFRNEIDPEPKVLYLDQPKTNQRLDYAPCFSSPSPTSSLSLTTSKASRYHDEKKVKNEGMGQSIDRLILAGGAPLLKTRVRLGI